MIQFCMMSGHEGRMGSEKKLYITLMGACELVRPTFARQMLSRREAAQNGKSSRNWQFFLTIMGAAEVCAPTLAEEFIDLRDLVNTGVIARDDLDHSLSGAEPETISISSFTLMGYFSDSGLPGENVEIDSLALHRHLGNIPESAGQVLQLGIGQKDAERHATIRRAVLAAVSG